MITTLLPLPYPLLALLLSAVAALAFSQTTRLTARAQGWLLAAGPLAAFLLLVNAGEAVKTAPLSWSVSWIPTHAVRVGFYLDGLSLLFALLVTGIGTLIVLYTGYYFTGEEGSWRFHTWLLLFMASMVGLVMAGDIITLFIFWEGTTITSFFLVAYKYKYPEARAGAFKALFITGGGGIVMLAGLLMVSHVAGGTDFVTILENRAALQGSSLYLLMLILVAIGAFTKSAQFPAHIWLPDAMSAPAPASAFLHSATMVKAGIYLMARLNPALGGTELWYWLLTGVGVTTMIVGAWHGVRQNDLKGLLAYSTISQLGVLMALIGQNTSVAFKALAIGIVAHALYKSALFLLAGIIDHETGTRELSRLGGLRREMPWSFRITAVAALSMAGLPPMFGFLAKETLLDSALKSNANLVVSWIFAGAVVIAGALMLVMAGKVALAVFTGPKRDSTVHGHDPSWWMLLAPGVPASISLVLGLFPEFPNAAKLLEYAAEAAYGGNVSVYLDLWHGFNLPVLLSVIAVSSGILLYWKPGLLNGIQGWLDTGYTLNGGYQKLLAGIDKSAEIAARLQNGMLRLYLSIILLAAFGLVILFGGLRLPPQEILDNLFVWPALTPTDFVRLVTLAVAILSGMAIARLRRDFNAILAMGISGLAVALLMALEPAPDVALVQMVVDLLTMVILVLALTRIPRAQRSQVNQDRINEQGSRTWLRRGIGLLTGALVAFISLIALNTRGNNPTAVTAYYEANAESLTGARDIVGAILLDFRGIDTLLEITVFSVAGLGVLTLLLHAARKHGDDRWVSADIPPRLNQITTFGIGGRISSAFLTTGARIVLPLAFLLALIHILYGHVQPGDGFTAGVLFSLAIGLWYIVFGYEKTRATVAAFNGWYLIAMGILLVIGSGIVGAFTGNAFLAPVNYNLFNLPLPHDIKLSSGLVFEIGIATSVTGSLSLILSALGNPNPSQGDGITPPAPTRTHSHRR